jgi:metal-responsive CopG/Arc/MetJ family transcriptional regulator
MQESITVFLPGEIKTALDDASQREGLSASELAAEAIKEYLFSRQFRALRERLAAKAQSQGVVTDQDVFDRVS